MTISVEKPMSQGPREFKRAITWRCLLSNSRSSTLRTRRKAMCRSWRIHPHADLRTAIFASLLFSPVLQAVRRECAFNIVSAMTRFAGCVSLRKQPDFTRLKWGQMSVNVNTIKEALLDPMDRALHCVLACRQYYFTATHILRNEMQINISKGAHPWIIIWQSS